MKMIAVDMSSPKASLALLEEGRVIHEEQWTQQRRSGQQLFDYLERVRCKCGLAWNDVAGYVCGRGPGNYSGLRMSITALQSLALPDKRSLYFLNSGAAVAEHVFAQQNAGQVAVVGNARRQRLWYGIFRPSDAGAVLLDDWCLCEWNVFTETLQAEDMLCVSSCYNELKAQEEFRYIDALRWIPADVYPSAACLGRVAYGRMLQHIESEPAIPVYMHPPVNIENLNTQEPVS